MTNRPNTRADLQEPGALVSVEHLPAAPADSSVQAFGIKMKLAAFSLILIALLSVTVRADEVTVTNLTSKPEESYTYTEGDAGKIIKAVRNLTWDGTPGAGCHFPACRIVVKSDGRTTMDATVSFECHNMRFGAGKQAELKGFKMDEGSTRWLKQLLDAIFIKQKADPGAPPKNHGLRE